MQKKKCGKYEKELLSCENRRKKIFEAYEEGLISSDEFLERKSSISQDIERIQKKFDEAFTLSQKATGKEVPYKVIKDILQNFSRILNSDSIERGLKKQLLHMLISEITLDKRREIESIHLNLTDEMVQFLQNTDGTSLKGVPSNFLLSKLGIPMLNMKIAI